MRRQLLRGHLMFQLVSKPADFAPKRKVVDFDQTRVLRPGPKLRPVYDVAGSLLDDLGRDPNLRRVRDSDVGCASRAFGNLRRQNRSQGFVQIFQSVAILGKTGKTRGMPASDAFRTSW